MNGSSLQSRRILSARRIALLATTIAGIGAAAFVFAPNAASPFATAAHAQNLTEKVQQLPQTSRRLRRHRREGKARGDFGARQDRPAGRFQCQRRRSSVPARLAVRDASSSVSACRICRTAMRSSPARAPGFFISRDGYAVTNNHVVQNAENVQVTTDDGKTYSAKVIGTDPRTDLALIKIDGNDFPFVKLADTSPRVGDWVLAVGNPFGLGGTVTAGIVSARGRDIGAGPYDDFIQIDAPVNKGNSGGPTFDVDGNVIGVNTAIFSPSGGSVGIAFAIPADTVKSVVAQLRDKGSVTRGWIGVQIQSVTPDIADSMGLKQATGALVSEPQKDSPAAKAGIQSGDVITSVNDEPINDARELGAQDRHDVAGHDGEARHDPSGRGQDRDADARHFAGREAGGE